MTTALLVFLLTCFWITVAPVAAYHIGIHRGIALMKARMMEADSPP